MIGQILQVDREGDNIHDPFAVATSYGGSVVGHLPIDFQNLHGIFCSMVAALCARLLGDERDLQY